MKQHITEEQWKELTDKQQVAFIHSCKTKIGVPIWEGITMGQMIQFLGENNALRFEYGTGQLILPVDWSDYDKLCDALWEAVKQVLDYRKI